MNLAEFWPQCLRLLRTELNEQQFNMIIAPLTVGEEDGAWVIYAKNQFSLNLLRSQYGSKLETAREILVPEGPVLLLKIGNGKVYQISEELVSTDLTEAANGVKTPHVPAEVLKNNKKDAQYIISERMKALPQTPIKPKAEPEVKSKPNKAKTEEHEKQRHQKTNLSSDYTFDTLVEGKGNRIAAAAAQSIAENPGSYNPFFLYGSTGLGKTHLVQAVGNELLKRNPDAKVRYMHSDEYIRSFMNAVRNNLYDAFKQQYRNFDLLIIDDIQFIKGKDRTMEEFFYLYEHFHNEKKQLILTCDVLPVNIKDMDERLKSRFSWGLTLELEPPELEMRVAILQKKADILGVKLDDQAAFFIANLVRSNVRELEGAFNRVSASSRFLNKPIDIDLAKESLQDIVASTYKPITLDLIMDVASKYYHIKISDIIGKKRSRNIARPRQVAMTLTKELTNMSLPAIGEGYGGRDHTTVMHAVKTITKLREEDAEMAQDYEKLLILIQN
ncbi:MAG: chromosomal replication initiator protein DnaA [Neisseria sp.]